MAESQDSSFSSRPAAVSRSHSVNGALNLRPQDCFHPHRRQFSDDAAAHLQPCSPPSFSSPLEASSSNAQSHRDDMRPPWEQCKGSTQSSYSQLPAAPVEPASFLSQSYSSYSLAYPLQQVSSRIYPPNGSNHSKYSLQGVSAPLHQESTAQNIFPKPIYSYSILIFMALKNSRTGSLPVSEIYSFMTENFPYFKTAPDGWKNSVRHNLSLNKCFEKVENKNGGSSRKGCLWALNPAKVEKMQEELHKWRRKDPMAMRRSMAKPEDLERLLGERKDKLRSFPTYANPSLLSRVPPLFSNTPPPCSPVHLRPASSPIQRSHFAQIPPPQPCYLPPADAVAHPSNPLSLCSPCGQQPTATGSLNSPLAGKMPPTYGAALQADFGVGPRSMQDFLMEGDCSYDIDALNPTLTDLQLQGLLWDELRDDSLNPAAEQSAPISTSSVTAASQDYLTHNRCLQAAPLVSQVSSVTPAGRCRVECEDRESSVEQHGCLSGLHPVVYSGVESLAGYLTSCTTSISLL